MTETATDIRVQGFICMVPNYWGWGATREDAIAKCRKAARGNVSVAKGKRAMYALPEGAIDAFVDNMGMIHWKWEEGYTGDRTKTGEWIEEPA